MPDWSWQQEATKAGYNMAVALVTLGLGWLVGQRLTSFWALRQKRRELDFASSNELYRLYGEFFAVWKLWNYFLRNPGITTETKDVQWVLIQRAAMVDAGFEALLVKITSERALTEADRLDLGLLRQGFQQLRERIKANRPLDWPRSEHPEYLEFKRLAGVVANLLVAEHDWPALAPQAVTTALIEVTSNQHEQRWQEIAKSHVKAGAA